MYFVTPYKNCFIMGSQLLACKGTLNRMCRHWRVRSDCASAEPSQNLKCSYIQCKHPGGSKHCKEKIPRLTIYTSIRSFCMWCQLYFWWEIRKLFLNYPQSPTSWSDSSALFSYVFFYFIGPNYVSSPWPDINSNHVTNFCVIF